MLKNPTIGLIKAATKLNQFQVYGFSKGGILEINFTGKDFSGVILTDFKHIGNLKVDNVCGPDLVDYNDYYTFNSTNKIFVFQFNRIFTASPVEYKCSNTRVGYSYRYKNPKNVDNNLLNLPYVLIPITFVYVLISVLYIIRFNDLLLVFSGIIKCLSLSIFSLIWSNEWIVEHLCKYLVYYI